MTRAVLSIGSNLGDRLANLRIAVDGLAEAVVGVSGVYETVAWGVTDQPDFLNAVLLVDDQGTDEWGWLRRGQALENAAGRVRTRHWGPRTLDVDVDAVLAQAQAEADELAAEVRRALEALEEDGADRLFDEIYAEPHQELERQRREHALYLQQFGDEEAGA